MNIEENALSYLKAKEGELTGLAKDIWDHPQLGLEESYAAELISGQLEKGGFSVRRGIAQTPTAFIGSWGEDKPIVGILGEYDALPGLSQKVSNKKEAIIKGGPGHGCGHNLFGIASLGAALAVKETMERDKIKGTIRYYGCPAEETLTGKVLMARDGVFDDLDAAITWHPMAANTVWNSSSLAMNSFKFNFHGISAHAGASPEMGRSALDAVMLTDIGINYLREHVIQETRIHCVITNGGLAPNVVPDYAQVWYYIRAPHREQVEETYARVLDIAKGAALMTGTTYDVEFIIGCYDYLPNDVLGKVILEKLKKVGAPSFTGEEKAFAEQLQATLQAGAIDSLIKSFGLTKEEVGYPLCDKILDRADSFAKGKILPGSTDVGDVSYITPTAQCTTTCTALGIPVHSWQSTATFGSSIGFKGMMVAARTLALTALDLETKPDILKMARDEFKKEIGGKRYVSASA